MSERRFEGAFRRWSMARGFDWSPILFRRGQGQAHAIRIRPPDPAGVVVVAHGAGNDALFAFVGLFKRLLDRGLEVFSFDLDGHGRESTTVLDPERIATAVPQAVEESGAAERDLPLHLLGVSVGGALLLHALPDLRVASAVTICAPLQIRFGWRSVLNELRPHLLRRAWAERNHYGLTGLIPSVGPFQRGSYPIRLEHPEEGAFGYVRVIDGILERFDLQERVRSIRAPVLLIAGERDRLAPPDQAVALAARIPHAEARVMAGETHLSLPLAPRTGDLMVDWFSRHPDRSGSSSCTAHPEANAAQQNRSVR